MQPCRTPWARRRNVMEEGSARVKRRPCCAAATAGGGASVRRTSGFVSPALSRIARCAVLALALACVLAGSRAGAQSAASPDDATFMLLTVTQDGKQQFSLGTAFFVDADGTALTNSHVVYRARQDPERYRLMAIVGREFYGAAIVCASALKYDPRGGPVLKEHDIGLDLAEIKLAPSQFRFATFSFAGAERTAHLTGMPRFPALALGGNPSPGAAVRIVGYGLIGFPPTPGTRWTATGTVDEVGEVTDGTPAFRVVSTNRPREGNSGSPVLDAAGQVVGIWTWNDDDNLAYGVAIASSALKKPCATARVAGPPGPVAMTAR